MTRINVIPVEQLTDQHLMAEYRELPMVLSAARRSDPRNYQASNRYTLNQGHVKFFFNKRKYLMDRWLDLIAELYNRGFKIDPASRTVHWRAADKFKQVDWQPDDRAKQINLQRIEERINAKRHWYKFRGQPLP